MSIWGPWQYLKELLRPSEKLLCSIITFVLSWTAFFLRSVDFLNCPKGSVAHLCWSFSVVSRRCVHITIWNQSGNLSNQYQFCDYCKYWSVIKCLAFSERDFENCWRSVTRCHLKILRRVHESSSLTQGLLWYLLKMVTSKGDCAICRIMRRNIFLASRIIVETMRQTKLDALSLSAESKGVE